MNTLIAPLLLLAFAAHLTQANWEFTPKHPTWPANTTGAGRHARATCTGCAVSCFRPGYCGSSHTGCKHCLPGYKAYGCGTGGSFCRKVEPAPTDPSVLVDNTNQASTKAQRVHDPSKCLEDNGSGLKPDDDCVDCADTPAVGCAGGYDLVIESHVGRQLGLEQQGSNEGNHGRGPAAAAC